MEDERLTYVIAVAAALCAEEKELVDALYALLSAEQSERPHSLSLSAMKVVHRNPKTQIAQPSTLPSDFDR